MNNRNNAEKNFERKTNEVIYFKPITVWKPSYSCVLFTILVCVETSFLSEAPIWFIEELRGVWEIRSH